MSVDLRNSLFMTNSLVILDWTYPLDLPLSLGLALIPWTCPYPLDLPFSRQFWERSAGLKKPAFYHDLA